MKKACVRKKIVLQSIAMSNDFETRYIGARKRFIEAEFSRLNSMQRQAVLTTEGPLLLLAGAGSGKTTVLIHRIANLLQYGRASDTDELPDDASEDDIALLERCAGKPDDPKYRTAQTRAAYGRVDPWRIIAITFTNKAAGELKERLEKMLGPQAADIWASTFHSACVRILRRDADRLGYPNSFTIYDTSDSQSVMKHIIKDMELDDKSFPYRALLAEISRAKDAQITPETYLTRARATGDIRKIKIGEAYAEYWRRLFSAGAMDFDDLIYNTVRLLSDFDDVREYWQRKFQYVLIDEYQDTNNLQYQLAALLADGWGNICVVGDDDQSIYKFRGATIENILNFEQQYKRARTIRLEQNYRSTGHILNAANHVIANNVGRKGKTLWTNADAGDPLTLYVAQNENDEAQYVAMKIMEDYGRGENFRDHAILYRMNAQSNQMEYAFKRNGIPYRIIGGTRFFDRAEVKDMLAYLCVIQSPEDDLRLTRIINNPPRGIGARSVQTATELAQEQNTSLMEIVRHADQYPALQRSSLRLRQFAILMDELRAASETMTPEELYDLVLERTGYVRALEEKNTAEDTARIENVQELKTNIINYCKESENGTLAGFLDEVALYTDIDNYDKDADCVTMMTMHAAKGLEFPTVFVVGCEEGIFPGLRAIGEPDEMEEERRLCYVALTRAKRKLYLTCARQRMLFGRTTANRISRFVEEIPADDLEQRNVPRGYRYSDQTPEQKEYHAAARSTTRTRPVAAPPRPAEKAAAPAFALGDRVRHRAFGLGKIVKVSPMGGDALLEITFDTVGTKRLMLRAASQYMTKEEP